MNTCLIPKSRFSAFFTLLIVSLAVSELHELQTAAAEANSSDRVVCESNLTTLFKAIQAYRAEKKDLPAWLSDLIPKYVKDPNVLVCPIIKRTGTVTTFGIEDPKISTAYLYEFAETPVPGGIQGGSQRTMKEWKRRQMGLVGSKIPMVRCHHHSPVLNLSFDGRVYEGAGAWEHDLTEVSPDDLSPARLFAAESALTAALKTQADIPPRDPKTPANLIDLTSVYNAALTDTWHRTGPNEPVANDLSSLPRGVHKFAGVEFDTRGLIQLGSRKLSHPRFPLSAKQIKVDQKATRLHFLHSTGWSAPDGTPVASFIVRLANGHTHEFTILYGDHVTDWVAWQPQPKDRDNSVVAWAGTSPATGGQTTLHLFKTQWANPEPDQPISSIDYVASNLDPAPFLVAITAEAQ
jgi:hypothetical protein